MTEWEHMTKRRGFLDAQLGKGWRAPFTGFTWRALQAFIALADTWYRADQSNSPRIENAMRELAMTFQPSEMETVRMTIYGVGNEAAMLRLWPRISPLCRIAAESESL